MLSIYFYNIYTFNFIYIPTKNLLQYVAESLFENCLVRHYHFNTFVRSSDRWIWYFLGFFQVSRYKQNLRDKETKFVGKSSRFQHPGEKAQQLVVTGWVMCRGCMISQRQRPPLRLIPDTSLFGVLVSNTLRVFVLFSLAPIFITPASLTATRALLSWCILWHLRLRSLCKHEPFVPEDRLGSFVLVFAKTFVPRTQRFIPNS